MAKDAVTLYHAPNTRSSSVLHALEELGVTYDLHLLNMKKNEHHAPAYLAINPLGKVPALHHNGAIVTEQVAILLYLADAFPTAGLAPKIGDPQRGPYLRWMTMYAAAWEPAIVDRAMKREPGQRAMSPYGEFDTLFNAVAAQLAKGPWLLGEKYSVADVLWGGALRWMTMFKILPENAAVTAYLARCAARPAQARALAKDADLAKQIA